DELVADTVRDDLALPAIARLTEQSDELVRTLRERRAKAAEAGGELPPPSEEALTRARGTARPGCGAGSTSPTRRTALRRARSSPGRARAPAAARPRPPGPRTRLRRGSR